VREGNLDKDKVIIIVDKDMHESIAGIIAGRLKDKLYKPVIILTKAMSGLKGSGRSIPEYNMYDELYRVKNLLVKFGGHAMAAGLSIEEDNVNQLRTVLNKNCSLCSEDFLETLKIDCSLEFKNISLYLAYELCLIEPYGTNNPEPLFVSRGVYISTIRIMEHKNTIIFNFKDSEGMELKGICFNLVDVFKDRFISTYGQNEFNLISKSIISKVYSMDIVYTINLNTYRKAEAQLNIRDFKFY
jgi:single-stranded-DNA-specific exonuclease